jgi:hypothetical protein
MDRFIFLVILICFILFFLNRKPFIEKFGNNIIPYGTVYSIHYTQINNFKPIWYFFNYYSNYIKGISDISNYHTLYTENMELHFKNCFYNPNIDLYSSRELSKYRNHILTIRDSIENDYNKLTYKINHPKLKTNINLYPGVGVINSSNDMMLRYNDLLVQSNGKFQCGNKKLKSELHNIIKNIYGDEFIELRGWFWYPPKGFREWHTNRYDPPGWRIYLLSVEEDNKSWFLLRDPKTGELKKYNDKNGYVNIFKLYSEKENLIWHSICSQTNRFSLGMYFTDSFIEKLIYKKL